MKTHTLAKIVCTIGPSSWDEKTLKELADAGMSVARINASFADFAELERVASLIRKVAPKVTILLDTMGHKIRVSGFEEDINVKTGDSLILMPDTGDKLLPGYIATTYPELSKYVKSGNQILIDDGNIILEVTDIKDKEVHCKVTFGGTIKRRKTVNFPNIHIDFPGLTEKDKSDIKNGIESNLIDIISASFVRNKDDALLFREAMGETHVKMFAKIEDWEGVEKFDEILEIVDGIMVARGDMGVELPMEKVPIYQKEFVRKCREQGKPVIVATQMLESMRENARPTRAEVTDVANAVLDGADMLMLSAETSTGKHPVLAVSTMKTIITEAQTILKASILDTKTNASQETDSLCRNIAKISQEIDIKGVVVLSQTGKTVASLSRHRLNIPIWGVCNNPLLIRQFNLYFGVEGIYVNSFSNHRDDLIKQVVGVVYSHGNLELTDKIAIISGSSIYNKSINSILEIVSVQESLN